MGTPRRFTATSVLRHFGQMGFEKSVESRYKTENTFRTHSEPIEHAQNLTKQICPEGIETLITSLPYNTALGTYGRLLC